jgi:putative addiction module component (TIGR02574 family)
VNEEAAMAAALIDKLEGADDAPAPEAWRRELLRRRDDLRSGSATTVPWTEARARPSAL